MKLLIITHVSHAYYNQEFWAYGPYVREINIWEKQVSKLAVIAPLKSNNPLPIDLPYHSTDIDFYSVPSFSLVGIGNKVKTIFAVPIIIWKMYFAMFRADHIHLRCPGNIGLLGCLLQLLFPFKHKTAKYAGNWDWNSKQPLSYRLQQRILRNTFFTRNMQVLVYGDWKETKNIKPFFTASYSRNEINTTSPRELNRVKPIKLLFVGTLNEGKRPMISLETVKLLKERGHDCEINFFGDGPELMKLKNFCEREFIRSSVYFHGNVNSEVVKLAYQDSQFLLFASQSEGWPKVVAESMFWGCLPITTAVSCVPEMVGNGLRGDLVEPNAEAITSRIEYYLNNPKEYHKKCEEAMIWSRQFTLEKFEDEIKKLLV